VVLVGLVRRERQILAGSGGKVSRHRASSDAVAGAPLIMAIAAATDARAAIDQAGKDLPRNPSSRGLYRPASVRRIESNSSSVISPRA
jgi:hypothetical protein